MFLGCGGGCEWTADGQLYNCSEDGPYEPWYPEGSDPQFHIDNKAFETEYYQKHTWHNWQELCGYSPITKVPDNVTDDWLAVCIELCQSYLEAYSWTPKIGLEIDYVDVSMDENGKVHSTRQRKMMPRTQYEKLNLDKPRMTEILNRLLDIAADRAIL